MLAPHTDDGELGCGGTMARLVEAGCEVRYVAFSIATRSLPEGFPPETLAREVRDATAELGIPVANLTVHDFDVRTFPDHRQEILELLIGIWNDWEPDLVFQPHPRESRSQWGADRETARLAGGSHGVVQRLARAHAGDGR